IFSDIFGDSTLNLVYAAALLIGAVYSFFLLFFNDVVEGALHIDLDLDGDLSGHDAGDAVGVSMLAVASFISSFGAFGLISVTLFDAGTIPSLIVAILGGLLIGIAAQFFFLYILSPTVSSEVRQANIIGMVAEITTPIPANGVGQIAFVAEGSRVTYTARATDQTRVLTRGTPVRVERIVGGVAYVSEID
ncbi:MAG: NfeD family protein, partial [Anaerolineae bacterium]|nr:NfeD family protein [Anaerolineae bacterium]